MKFWKGEGVFCLYCIGVNRLKTQPAAGTRSLTRRGSTGRGGSKFLLLINLLHFTLKVLVYMHVLGDVGATLHVQRLEDDFESLLSLSM